MSQQRKERVISSSIWKVIYDTTTANYAGTHLAGLSTTVGNFTTQAVVTSTRVVVPDALKKYVQHPKHRDIGTK